MQEIKKPVFNNVQNTKHITTEGKEIWENRSCAVVNHIIAQKQNSDDPNDVSLYYIIGKRGLGVDNSNLLNIPCGYMDWNENLEQAAKREIYEEAGFIIDNYKDKAIINFLDKPWDVNTEPIENRQNIVMHIGFLFLVGENEELPTLSLDNMEPDECLSVEWMEINDIFNSNDTDWAFNHKAKAIEFLSYLNDITEFEKIIQAQK